MRLLAFALLLPLAACDSGSGPDGAGPDAERAALLTDERSYVRGGSLAVHVSLENVSDAPVYVASPSFDTVLERREGGAWVRVGAWYTVVGLTPAPTAVAPGARRTWPALTVREPEFALEPGTYRVRTRAYEDPHLQRLLPEEDLVSPAFEVVGG